MYVSVNKQLINFQNFVGVLSWHCQGIGYKNVLVSKVPAWTQICLAGNVFPVVQFSSIPYF